MRPLLIPADPSFTPCLAMPGSSSQARGLLARRQYLPLKTCLTPVNGLVCQNPCHVHPAESAPPAGSFVFHRQQSVLSESFHTRFLPSQPPALLASPETLANQVASHPDFLLQSVTSFHRSGLHHYYGFICHPAPLQTRLGFPLVRILPSRDDTGLPRFIVRTPVRFTDLNHTTGLTEYRASPHLESSPACSAVSGSLTLRPPHFLSLPSDPAVTSNALASRIVFPSVGATPASLSWAGCPVLPGKQKGEVLKPHPFLIWWS